MLRQWLPDVDPGMLEAAAADPLPPDASGYAAAVEWLDTWRGVGMAHAWTAGQFGPLLGAPLRRAQEAYRSAASLTDADALGPAELATLQADRLDVKVVPKHHPAPFDVMRTPGPGVVTMACESKQQTVTEHDVMELARRATENGVCIALYAALGVSSRHCRPTACAPTHCATTA